MCYNYSKIDIGVFLNMKNANYSAGLVSKLLWFNELKRTAELRVEISDIEELKKVVIRDNIYQINNIERVTRIFNYCIKRLDDLDSELTALLINGDTTDSKIITLISTMQHEKILFDFVYEVYREKIMLGDYEITEKDMKVFMDYKVSQSKEVARWSESSIAKISQTILKMLSESGLIIQDVRRRTIEKPLMSLRLEKYLKENMLAYYKAIMGEL